MTSNVIETSHFKTEFELAHTTTEANHHLSPPITKSGISMNILSYLADFIFCHSHWLSVIEFCHGFLSWISVMDFCHGFSIMDFLSWISVMDFLLWIFCYGFSVMDFLWCIFCHFAVVVLFLRELCDVKGFFLCINSLLQTKNSSTVAVLQKMFVMLLVHYDKVLVNYWKN